jgi:histidine triad (HIT) family protein
MAIVHNHTDCVFCQIIKGNPPDSLIYQDDKVVVFPTLEPVNPGHVLVVPKVHATYFADLEEETAGHIMKIAQKVASAIRISNVKCEGINIFVADGEAAGQELFHFHLHVYPRFKEDGFGFKYDKSKHFVRMNRMEMEKIAEEIRSHLKSKRPAINNVGDSLYDSY